ncbi:MAG: translocation/assembly module TamB domain-containing protein, partial [Dissulfurispiraceae bacterium]
MKRRLLYIAAAVLLTGIYLYASRGPNISNALKRIILPELEAATGRKFVAQQIYINVFPLFAEIKGLKSFDDNGEKILEVERVKGYLGLSGLIQRKITIKRLVLKNPDIRADKKQIAEISANITKYLAGQPKSSLKVEVKSVSVYDAELSYKDKDYGLLMGGFSADVILGQTPKFIVASKKMVFDKKGLREAKGSLEAEFRLRNSMLDLKNLKITSYGSGINTSGSLDTSSLIGRFTSEAVIYLDTVKKIFGLKRNGDGQITVSGSIGFDGLKSGINSIFADVKVKGDLFIETLMEFLNVKEKITGHISVEGFLKGPVNNLHAEGKAVLDKGNLFGVPVDKLDCKLSYQDGALRFLDGKAGILHGSALAEGMIRLPVVNYFEVKVRAEDVSSEGLLKLIGLHGILPEGKVNGTLATAGRDFDPAGQFFYRRTIAGRDILGRVRNIKSRYSMKKQVLSFDQMFFSSDKSRLSAAGSLDLEKSTLSFRGEGETEDIRDLSSPYFTALSGAARFSHAVSGSLNDPVIDMHFDAHQTTLAARGLAASAAASNNDFIFDTVEGTLHYKKKELTLEHFSAKSPKEKVGASGSILFPRAAKLFDLKKPDFNLSVSARDIGIKKVAALFTGKSAVSGVLDTDFNLSGGLGAIRLSGEVHGSDITVSDQYAINNADGHISYERGSLSIKSLRLMKGTSTVDISGFVGPHDKFSLDATGKSIRLSDIIPEKDKDKLKLRYKELFADNFFDTVSISNLCINGSGTFGSPIISLRGDIHAGAYRGRPVGSGDIIGELNGKNLTVTARLLDKKLKINGGVQLTGTMQWHATADLQSARYDFIAANLLKDVPDDLLINLRGNIIARGDKDHINVSAKIDEAHVYLYGTGYTSSSGIMLTLVDKKLSIGSISMKSETSELRLAGTVSIGSGYDLLIEGSSSLAPLKALSRNIDLIKGNASFVCSITGDWNKPRINGDMEVSNGALGFRNVRYRLSSVSAYLYFDEDRIILDRCSGKLFGSDITATGSAYLQKFTIKRFLFSSSLSNATASVSKDLWVNFNAELNYRGTPDSQTILGDVEIKRAKYTAMVEWKSWLLGFRQKQRPRAESSGLDNTNLNVRVRGADLMIDTNVAKASANMDLLLKGNVSQPVVLGKVEAKEGIVYFRNNEFKILQTTLDFSNPNQIAPYFTIVAETKVRGYNIRLSLNGYIDQFNLALSSDPFLAESDIFSLLTIGQIGKNLKGLEGGIGASEAASFLTGKMQDVVEERLRTITGLDRLSIETSVSSRSESALTTTSALTNVTGTVSPRVTVSKRLLGDKLYVTYSTASGAGEEQVWRL